jgi:hypothetical protein
MKNIIKVILAIVVVWVSGAALAEPSNSGGILKACATCKK